MVYLDQCRTWCEYAYIKEIITRYNDYKKEYVVLAVVVDKNLNGTVQQSPDLIKRIDKPTPSISAETGEIDIAEIQARTLKALNDNKERR